MKRLLLPLAGLACAVLPWAGGVAPPSPGAPLSTSTAFDEMRSLQSTGDDATPATLQKLEDGTLSIQPHCYVSASSIDDIMVWCDIYLPIGLEAKAEIKEGTCEEFTEAASGDSYLLGVASPVFYPQISDEEKREGTFEQSYCARMDIFHDDEHSGETVSGMERRYPVEVSYNFTGEVEEESVATTSLADFSIYFGDAVEGANKNVNVLEGGEMVDEQTSPNASSEEDTDGGRTGMYIGLSVAVGVAIIILLAVIVRGKRKKSHRGAGGEGDGEAEESTRRVFEEWVLRGTLRDGVDVPPEKIDAETTPTPGSSPARTARSVSSLSGGNEEGEPKWIGDVEVSFMRNKDAEAEQFVTSWPPTST